LLIVVVLLAYSRGALLALVLGCAFWFAVVPLRLRGFAVLAAGVAGAVVVIAWAFGQAALSDDRVPLDLRDQAGHQLLIAMIFMLIALLVVGLAVGFHASRRSPSPLARRRAGIAILVALALIPVAVAGGLISSHRGLGGSISHAWDSLTNPNAKLPSNDPGRLTAVGSVRARYWNDAFKITGDHPLIGVGAGGYDTARLHYRNDNLQVEHAHGYVVQTLADRGVLGLILSLAALAALSVAIALATGLRRGGAALRTTPERVGLLTLTTVIVVFGVHSFVDWTWFVPGVTIPALLAGGWLAGRGALELPPRIPTRLLARIRTGIDSRERLTAAVAAIVLAVCAAWAAWQPQRSIDAGDQALAALAATPPKIGTARELGRKAQQRNPVAVDPYFAQSVIETKAGNLPGAERALQKAVQLQPANPSTWISLANFQLSERHNAAAAKRTLAAALYLDPKSFQAIQVLLEINRQLGATG
jgi:O-antigen ligase